MTVTDRPRRAARPPAPAGTPGTATPSWHRRQGRRVLAAVMLLTALVAGLVAWRVQLAEDAAAAEAARLGVLREAVADCALDGQVGVDLVDGDRSLLIDTAGEDDRAAASSEHLGCVLRVTRAPPALIAEMAATGALDGRRTGSWGDVTASWSYHPRTGMDLALTIE